MPRSKYFSRAALLMALLFSFASSIDSAAAKKAEVKPAGTPKLWRDPGDIASKDLYWGRGSEAETPKPPFKFIEEDLSGTNPKVHITDANGTKWSVKFESSTNEVHSEVVANRLLWALGYAVDDMYFVPSGHIEGVGKIKRVKSSLKADGSFTNARFKKKSKTEKRLGYQWSWNDNPFVGTRELSGLKVLMTMINNWDTKSTNNDVVEIKKENGEIEDWYIVSDLGATFGKMATLPMNKNRWNLEDFQRQKFIDRYLNNGNEIKLHYRGKSSIGTVPTEHARWFAGQVGQLTESQFRKALDAAGAPPDVASGYTARLLEKVRELKAFTMQQTPGSPLTPGKEVELRVKLTKRP